MTVAFWIKQGRKMESVQVLEDRYSLSQTNSRYYCLCLQAAKLLKILQHRSNAETKSIFTMKEIKQFGEQVGIEKNKIYNIVESLNLQGFLLIKGGSRYELATANV